MPRKADKDVDMQKLKRLASVCLVAALGCSGLPSSREVESLPEYEQARRQVEDPLRDGGVQQASFEEAEPVKVQADEPWYAPITPDGISKRTKRAYQKATGTEPSREAARQHFQEAEAQFRAAQGMPDGPEQHEAFLAAAASYQKSASRWPESAIEHDALFMAAEALFFGHQYPKANEAYELLLKKYPSSRYIDRIDAHRFAIANWWLQLEQKDADAWYEMHISDKRMPWRDRYGHAIRIFDRIRLDDPTGKLADDATMAAGNAMFLTGQFLRADEYYSDLRRTFPSSEHQFKAHLLGMKAKLLSYQGPDYSETPLVEAEKLVDQIRKQFPREYSQDRQEIDMAHAETRKLMAERDTKMAKYYDRRDEYGAAKFYYQMVIDEYPGTPLASEAEERIAALGGKPDVPPQKLEWLANAFPSEKDPQPKPLMATQPSLNIKR